MLDECTSTFSEELAERVYWAMAAHDITIVTISHRPKHKRFHQQLLSLTGEGAWALTATDPGVQTPPATPPATPRADFDPSTTTPQARRTEKSACEKAGPEISSGPNRSMARQATVIRRLVMILRILTSRGRSTTFLLLHVACIFLSVGLQSRILAALPGQLQALAMQSNRAAYINLSMSAFGFRLLSAGSSFLSAWAGNMLNIEWQGELTQHIINRMMGADSLFYKLERVDKRVDDVETRVVADVNLLAAAMQSIITSMLTPISSAVLATRLLVSANLPLAAINIIWAYGISGVLIQKFWAPDYAVFAALTSAKQGVFRRGHQRLIANAESIAMMSGEERELETLEEMLDDVTRESHRQLYYLTRFNCLNYWFTQYLPILVTNGMRMFWAMGYGSDQAILSEANGTGISSKGLYLENLITQSFEATVGLLSLNNYFQTLFGHVVRVTDLLLVIDEIQTGTGTTQPRSADSVTDGHSQEDISLTNVNIVVPDGTQLITGLELRLRPGERLMVTGNGKSSVFRVLTGVWHARGVVNAPRDSLSVPQQPLVTSTPVDLLTYLSYPLELNRREQTNARTELEKLLEGFGADYVIKREGWIVCRHWVDVLSLGELQCLALARAFFLLSYNGSRLTGTTTEPSAPSQYSWLFLDDCTSALTAEVEAKVYRQVEEVTATDNVRGHKVGVVSFGSGERESLSGFHDRVLRLGIDSMAIERHCNWQLEAVPQHVPGHTSLNEQHPSEFRLEELQLGQGALDRS